MYSDDVWNLNPGYDLGGWKFAGFVNAENLSAIDSYGLATEYISTDSSGYVTSVYASPLYMCFYGSDYTPSSRTPYTICYMTENLTPETYTLYSSKILRGRTSTPSSPSYTEAASALISIPGFINSGSITEEEILADSSTKVYVYYNRKNITINIVINFSHLLAYIIQFRI